MRYTFLIVAFFMSGAALAADAINAVRFKDENWSSGLLNRVEQGPSILSRSDQYDLAPPPENSSAEVAEELAFLHKIALEKRDVETIERIHFENEIARAHDVFVQEGLIVAENYKTMALLDMIDQEHGYFILERKRYFQRARPSEIDPTLSTVIPNPPYAAYPSGHAAQTHIVAMVLADFDPDNAGRYKQLAHDIAFRREIAGIHFKSDTVAGRAMAEDIYKKLRAVPVFEKKYEQAKLSYIKPTLDKEED